jgi:hypothetical protein
MVDTDTAAGIVLYGGVQDGWTLEFAEVWSYDATQNRWQQLLGGSDVPTM